jgi:hypothetical protein
LSEELVTTHAVKEIKQDVEEFVRIAIEDKNSKVQIHDVFSLITTSVKGARRVPNLKIEVLLIYYITIQSLSTSYAHC